jgi:hypothetical protein
VFLTAGVVLLVGCSSACRDEEPVRQEPATVESPELPPGDAPGSAESETPSEPRAVPVPKDPLHYGFELLTIEQEHAGWVQVREFFNEGNKASIRADYEGSNRVILVTSNVRRMELDLGSLPRNPAKSMAIRLDGQGIELSSKHGQVVGFERSEAGKWSLAK